GSPRRRSTRPLLLFSTPCPEPQSGAGEVWRALLEERGHRLDEVVGAEEGRVPDGDVVEGLFDRAALTGAKHRFGALYGQRRVGGDLARQVEGGLVERLDVGQHVVDEPDLARAVRGDVLARERE